jgi:hypothetical protein
VNLNVQKSLALTGSSRRYFCECENRGCRERVFLAADEFDAIVADGAALVISPNCLPRTVNAARSLGSIAPASGRVRLHFRWSRRTSMVRAYRGFRVVCEIAGAVWVIALARLFATVAAYRVVLAAYRWEIKRSRPLLAGVARDAAGAAAGSLRVRRAALARGLRPRRARAAVLLAAAARSTAAWF